eukprot:TRINITY_DN10069_c0_g1_i1.p1 TRINITY_DN10069_c0_g1~~TRINITY_DN10069_c0_g1_i1.p1  ORF type:complete len:115 (-),score=49.52 TRINITY_DN10069_c0_g1_i1:71-415(-)
MIRQPPRSTQSRSSAASDVYKRQVNKMRMLSLVNLATESAEIDYSTIAETLQITSDEVEPWVIKVSRAGLVKTRMDQLRQVVVVSRTRVRVLNNNDWCMLGLSLIHISEPTRPY